MKKKTESHTKYRQNLFHSQYVHTDYFEYWLEKFVKDGSCLNVCCGKSLIGNVRVDISKDSTRTHEGDLFKILKSFKPNSFDYVYCDPLFKYYTSGINRFNWQFDLFSLCKIALITRRPKVTINMPSYRHEYLILEDTRPSLSLVRIDWKK